jgi:hypothetical protein
MGDDLDLPERDCARTPMQWSTEPNAGFTTHAKPVMPVITEGAYGFRQVNVAAQRRDPDSFLNWMERIIRMRKEVPEIGWGDFSFVRIRTLGVLAMEYEWRNNSVLLLHNLTAEPRELRFRLTSKCAGENDRLINLLSDDHSYADESGYHCFLVEPYGYRWFRVGVWITFCVVPKCRGHARVDDAGNSHLGEASDLVGLARLALAGSFRSFAIQRRGVLRNQSKVLITRVPNQLLTAPNMSY